MKPVKYYKVRQPTYVAMRELEAGDAPHDHQGRRLVYVPGDYLVDTPFQCYVLARDLAEVLYQER